MDRPVIRIEPQRRHIPPIYISHTAGVSPEYVAAASDAVRRVTEIAGVEVPAKYFGDFRVGDGPYESAEWYVQQAWNPQRRQLNASQMLNLSRVEPWQRQQTHYEIWISGMDLWSGEADNNFVFGLTQRGFGTIQSYARIEAWYGRSGIPAEQLFEDILKHEVAHMFGTPREGRNHTQQILGTHCTNDPCIMGQVNIQGRPTLLEAARHRRRAGAEFCGECEDDLRAYFR